MDIFDDKLALFMDKDILLETVDTSVDKGIDLAQVRWFTQPENRIALAKQMLTGNYHIAPPHIIQIPKRDSSEMRKVYCNEPLDRIVCAQIGRVYEHMYRDRIHSNCVSYQRGIGVGRIVREISRYISAHPGLTGTKFDIHHYFDEVSEQARDQALKELDSGSCIDRIVWEYLHDDVVIDENNEVQHVYKGIAQGFAVSPFLANYILRDVDEAISKLNVLYYRYSDDILILGPDFEQARDILYRKLAEKGLTINSKKVTTIDADTEFTFLGFKIRGGHITFSEDTLKRVKKTIRSLTRTHKGQPLKDEAVLKKVIRQINRELYVAYLQNDREFGWAEYMFGTVNALEDIGELDRYIWDYKKNPDGLTVHAIMDDFACGCPITGFPNTISVCRSRNIFCSIIIQSIAQLETLYQTAACTICDNCDSVLFLGSNDPKTAQWIGERVNQPAHSILTMPVEEALLIRRGMPAKKVKRFNQEEYCDVASSYENEGICV